MGFSRQVPTACHDVRSLKLGWKLVVLYFDIFFAKKKVLTSTLHMGVSLLRKFFRISDVQTKSGSR